MKLQALRDNFKKGIILKADYIRRMHKKHLLLFDYADFIQRTDIEKIEILDKQIIMTARSTDIKIICDNIDERIAPLEILNFDTFEKNDFPMLLQLIDVRMIFFDIGANIGWVSIYICKMLKGTKVYAFEPIPKTYDYLQKNIALNNISNIMTYNFGFSNEDKVVTLYYTPHDSGSASLANLRTYGDMKKVAVHLMRLDDFVKQNKIKVDFIKCDVEGAELFVFQGGLKTIREHKPIIFSEMLRKWSKKFGYHPNDIIKLLQDLGYRCFVARNNRLKEIKKVDDETFETNFFFLHAIKHKHKIAHFKNK